MWSDEDAQFRGAFFEKFTYDSYLVLKGDCKECLIEITSMRTISVPLTVINVDCAVSIFEILEICIMIWMMVLVVAGIMIAELGFVESMI